MFLGFLGGPEDADSVISTFGADSCGRVRRDQAIRTADPGVSCWNGPGARKLQRSPATQLAVDDDRPTGQPTARSSARRCGAVAKARCVGGRWSAVAARRHPPLAPLT